NVGTPALQRAHVTRTAHQLFQILARGQQRRRNVGLSGTGVERIAGFFVGALLWLCQRLRCCRQRLGRLLAAVGNGRQQRCAVALCDLARQTAHVGQLGQRGWLPARQRQQRVITKNPFAWPVGVDGRLFAPLCQRCQYLLLGRRAAV